MIRVLIADDEPLARQLLRTVITAESDMEVVGEATDGAQACELAVSLRPDVAILDIQMPGPSGLEVARRMETVPVVVFATAYDAHAVAAFELQALDYLLKPFSRKRFRQTADRIRQALTERQDPMRREQAVRDHPERLVVRHRGRLVPVDVQGISRVRACDDYAELHTDSGVYLAGVRMKHLEERLAGFVRIHRSHLVNLEHMAALRPLEGGRAELQMRDGVVLPVSRRGRSLLRRLLGR
ncbi:MAG: response regulator [Rhodothermales bacterium]|nr:response regulator [Rhodothermales bacterium]MBO6780683.1 response regulator [Rhodothermales bacterium]